MAAVDLAREAAVQAAGADAVGEHVGHRVEGDRLVTHHFAARQPGYRGWSWAVTVARASRAKVVTVCEVVLLPGEEAILSPQWVPWADRIAPGDLGAGDVLPRREQDLNLEAGYEETGDQDADEVALWELGLGRPRVLAPQGRDAAAERWLAGPNAAGERAPQAACASCGYLLLLAGSLRQAFGVCANEWSPADGQVVSLGFGCGAHSETDVEQQPPASLPEPVLDEFAHDAMVLPRSGADEQVG